MNHSSKKNSHLAWYVAITKYRHEKSVSRQLKQRGIESFIPLHQVVRKYASGKKRYDIPLINCYVFVHMDIRNHVRVLELPGAIGFVKFCNEIVKVPDSDIELMRRIVGGDYPLQVLDHEVKEGDAVEVTAGRLVGVRGRILRINNKHKFVVSIDNIGRSITIEMDSKMLSPIQGLSLSTRK